MFVRARSKKGAFEARGLALDGILRSRPNGTRFRSKHSRPKKGPGPSYTHHGAASLFFRWEMCPGPRPGQKQKGRGARSPGGRRTIAARLLRPLGNVYFPQAIRRTMDLRAVGFLGEFGGYRGSLLFTSLFCVCARNRAGGVFECGACKNGAAPLPATPGLVFPVLILAVPGGRLMLTHSHQPREKP